MPKRKRDSDEEESAVESGADSEESQTRKKKQKKSTQKTQPKGKGSSKANRKEDVDTTEREVKDVTFNVTGSESWRVVGEKKKKRLTVRTFKGTTYVDIREFYEDKETGEHKPGKKGISLAVDEWHDIASIAEAVSTLVAEND